MKNLFLEKVKFPRILIILFWIQLVFFILYYLNKKDNSLLIFIIGLLIMGLFFSFSYTKIEISESCIKYGLIPLPKNKIKWNDVQKYEIVKISALSDFLGWGIRYSKKFGWSYIMKGDYAICFTLKSGKKKTISIENEKKLKTFLEKIGQ